MGVNNQKLAEYFNKHGVAFEVIQDWKENSDLIGRLDGYDILFRTPGLPYMSPAIQQAVKSGVQISSQTKLFFDLCRVPIIGITGTLVGGLGGLALCHVLDTYRLIKIPADVYQVAYVPFVVLPRDFTIVIVSAIVICFVATIYPSRQASRLDPVQALRFE